MVIKVAPKAIFITMSIKLFLALILWVHLQ